MLRPPSATGQSDAASIVNDMFPNMNQNSSTATQTQTQSLGNISLSSLLGLNGVSQPQPQTQTNTSQLSFADLAAAQLAQNQTGALGQNVNSVSFNQNQNLSPSQGSISPNFIPPTGNIFAGQSAPREIVIIGPNGEQQVVSGMQNNSTGKIVIPSSSSTSLTSLIDSEQPQVQNTSLSSLLMNQTQGANQATTHAKPASQLSTEQLLAILKARMAQGDKQVAQSRSMAVVDNQLLGVDDSYLSGDILDLQAKNQKAALVLQNLRKEQLSDKMVLLQQQLSLKDILEKQLRSRQTNKIQLKALIVQYQQKLNQMALAYKRKVNGLQALSNQIFASRQNMPQSLSRILILEYLRCLKRSMIISSEILPKVGSYQGSLADLKFCFETHHHYKKPQTTS